MVTSDLWTEQSIPMGRLPNVLYILTSDWQSAVGLSFNGRKSGPLPGSSSNISRMSADRLEDVLEVALRGNVEFDSPPVLKSLMGLICSILTEKTLRS